MREQLKHHLPHMLVCVAMVGVVGGLLLATGAGAVALLPAAACVLMMGAMLAMMVGVRR